MVQEIHPNTFTYLPITIDSGLSEIYPHIAEELGFLKQNLRDGGVFRVDFQNITTTLN